MVLRHPGFFQVLGIYLRDFCLHLDIMEVNGTVFVVLTALKNRHKRTLEHHLVRETVRQNANLQKSERRSVCVVPVYLCLTANTMTAQILAVVCEQHVCHLRTHQELKLFELLSIRSFSFVVCLHTCMKWSHKASG